VNSRTFVLCALALLAAACQSPQKASTPAAASASGGQKLDPAMTVAKVSGETITAKELEEKVGKDVRRLERQYQETLHRMRRQALESMVQEKVLEAKAKKEGLKPEDLVKRDVADKIGEPTEDQLRAFWEEQAKRNGYPPYDQVKDQIPRDQLVQATKGQLFQQKAMEYVEGLKKAASVEILLPEYQPPKVAVDASGPSRGPADAPVTIVEFSDFQCPFCARAEPTVKQLMEAYPGKIRLVYKDFPLPNHPLAPDAAEAAHCAGDQGKYWEMHEKLFASNGKLAVADLKGYAKDLGLDQGKFDQCLDSNEKAKLVEAHQKHGEEAGIASTPAFLVNGRLVEGAQPLEAFKKVVDEELAAAGKK
jgi:protein-disulfide isomerase